MAKFGARSREKVASCDERLQRVLNRAIKGFDFTVIYGHREKKDQDAAFKMGNSKVQWPDSKHNFIPSRAFDVAPWIGGQIPWNRVEYFYILAGVIGQAALEECVNLRWGGDWDGDGNIVKYDDDERLNDLGHFEVL